MAIKINGKDLEKRIINGQEVEKVMLNGVQIRPEIIPPTNDCFRVTGKNNGALVRILRPNYSSALQLETSTDGVNWVDYTLESQIELNQGDTVYFRNKSETTTVFTPVLSPYLYPPFLGQCYRIDGASITIEGDITYLVNKNGTDTLVGQNTFAHFFGELDGSATINVKLPATTLTDACYASMFGGCTADIRTPELPATTLTYGCYKNMFSCSSIVTPPALRATTLNWECYEGMFNRCVGLTSLPELPATTINQYAYEGMFSGCTSIKLSETQTGEYQTPYRIPSSGTGTVIYSALNGMFNSTGGTFTGTPTINTTYYTSNTIIS